MQVNLAEAVQDKYLCRDSYPVDINDENSPDLHNRIAREIVKNTQPNISSGENTIPENGCQGNCINLL